jgi:c-di-GMP-binding flagellar brake protein YcgR
MGKLKKPLFKYKTGFLSGLRQGPRLDEKSRFNGAVMNRVAMLSTDEPREILRTVIEKKTPAVLSFLASGIWHVEKVLLTNLEVNRLDVQLCPRRSPTLGSLRDGATDYPYVLSPKQEVPQLIDIQANQPVGISLKYGDVRIIFETTVAAIQPSTEPTSGPTITLMVPERIELVNRRSYFRVEVPSCLKVNVMLWHRPLGNEMAETQQIESQTTESGWMQQGCYWQGKLTNISAGGVQIVVDPGQKPDFKRGQFIGLRFTPMPYEMPLRFDAKIRNILPTEDGKSICLGLRIVGLEASPEGRQVLQRLCNVTEHYYQINQCSAKGQEFQTTGSSRPLEGRDSSH